jgi:hypothetical protein
MIRRFPGYDLNIIVQNIIPDKIFFVKFKNIGSRFHRPEDKALSLGIQTAGIILHPPALSQFPQIHPSGPPEGDLDKLAHSSPDNTGKDNLLFLNGGGSPGGQIRQGSGGNGQRFPDRRRRGLRFHRPY